MCVALGVSPGVFVGVDVFVGVGVGVEQGFSDKQDVHPLNKNPGPFHTTFIGPFSTVITV